MVDWMIGSDHPEYEVPAAQLRALVRLATGGSGVGGSAHCRVDVQSPAAAGVIIQGGSVAIPNEYVAWRAGYESYLAYWEWAQVQPIVPTSGLARSDLVVARVDDPLFSASQSPFTPASRIVIPNVAATQGADISNLRLGYPAYALALITQPPNNAQIAASMVKDLRRVSNPLTDFAEGQVTPTEIFSSYMAGHRMELGVVTIPAWATSIRWRVDVAGLRYTTTQTTGGMAAPLGDWYGRSVPWGGPSGVQSSHSVVNSVKRAAASGSVQAKLGLILSDQQTQGSADLTTNSVISWRVDFSGA